MACVHSPVMGRAQIATNQGRRQPFAPMGARMGSSMARACPNVMFISSAEKAAQMDIRVANDTDLATRRH